MKLYKARRLLGCVLMFLLVSSHLGADTVRLQAPDIALMLRDSIVVIEVRKNNRRISRASGFVVDQSGLIATNFHAIEGGDELVVSLTSGETFDRVFIVNFNERHDLALLQISTAELPAVKLGSSSALSVGDDVFVMSNPLGLSASFSSGMVSAKRVQDGVEMLQITAPISVGSSGGAVVNRMGVLVAIATSFLEGGQNLNLAIPVRYLRGLLAEPRISVRYEDFALQNWLSETVDYSGLSQWVIDAAEDLGFDLGLMADNLREHGEYQQQVMFQLMIIALSFSERSYEFVNALEMEALRVGSDLVGRFVLEGGSYRVAAACDQDCTSLFLIAMDDDQVLASSGLDSGLPEIEFEIATSTPVVIGVRMHQCSVQPCTTGATIFRK